MRDSSDQVPKGDSDEEEEEIAMVVQEEECSDGEDDWAGKTLPTLNTTAKESIKDAKVNASLTGRQKADLKKNVKNSRRI